MICPKCSGAGTNRHSGFACDRCDGTGWIDWMDVLVPWAVMILLAGVTLTLAEWVWHLFSKR